MNPGRVIIIVGLGLIIALFSVASASGQMGDGPVVMTFSIGGEQVLNAVDTMGTGSGIAALDGHLLVIGGTYSGLSSDVATDIAGGIHIHLGARGENGGVVFPVGNTGGTEGAFSGAFMLDDDQVQQFLDGLFYINIHTLNNMPGEIRGQVEGQ